MKSLTISGKVRKETGKRQNKDLRKNLEVPCVLYGGKENIHFSALEADFRKLIYSRDAYEVKLDIEGKAYSAVLKAAQYHPLTDDLLHADFIQMFEDRPVEITVPITLEGSAEGVRNGGVLRFAKRILSVKALPSAIPDEIVVNIEKLQIGDSIRVADLIEKFPNLTFLQSDNTVIARVKTARKAIVTEVEAVEGEEGAEAEEGAEGAEGPPAAEGAADGGEKKEEG